MLQRAPGLKRKVPVSMRKHSVLPPEAQGKQIPDSSAKANAAVPRIKGVTPEDPAEQKDQTTILKMLVQPQTFGQGLFDYSCNGTNWVVPEKLVRPRQCETHYRDTASPPSTSSPSRCLSTSRLSRYR